MYHKSGSCQPEIMINPNAFHTLLLATVPGIGHFRIRQLIRKFGSAEAVLAASHRHLVATDGIDRKMAEVIRKASSRDVDFVRDQMARLQKYKTHVLTFDDPEYPEVLKTVPDGPAFLFVRGNMASLKQPAIGIVGTREPTSYGKTMAETLARELAQRGIVIVSGLARGIDTHAHHAAVRTGGTTVAVLGSGVDRIYPPENLRLATDIMNQGAVVSEYPMNTAPDAVHFPGRNRIISGLSLGVVIVEAGEKSGALITANYALDQNREVYAVPGPVHAPKSKGPNRLIKQGAKLVETIDDILVEIEHRLTQTMPDALPQVQLDLTDVESKIYQNLLPEPLHVDVISQRSNLEVSEALNHLLALELQGVVRQLAGKHFCRV